MTMHFKKLELSDIPKVRDYFYGLKSNICDFTVGGMFMWRDYFNMEYDIVDNTFYSQLEDSDRSIYYSLPLGGSTVDSIIKQADYCKKNNQPASFYAIPEEYLCCFEQTGLPFRATEQPNYFDYLYLAENLIALPGKKYSGQRNQINQFKRRVSDWSFTPVTGENIAAVKEYFVNTYNASDSHTFSKDEESRKVIEVLDNIEKYRMVGGVLIADNAIAGFSLGEILGDTLFVHIEKASREFHGAYQMLSQQFATMYAANVKYINREEDMGVAGLKIAKQAYHPHALLKKYAIEVLI